MKVACDEAPSVRPPPGLEAPVRSKVVGKQLWAKRPSSSSSTTAGNVTTEEPSPEEIAPAYVAAEATGAALGEGAEQCPACGATISGLPNKVLTEVMFEAVLEQASLSHLVVNFELLPGKPSGEAKISLVSRMAAEQCALHFRGCQWDPSGAPVIVSLDIEECPENGDWELEMAAACTAGAEGLRLDASAEAFAFSDFSMSSEAPEFVPGGSKTMTRAINSDTSTEVGESEVEDEQESHQHVKGVGLTHDP
jgi:hypothetical protein